MNSISNPGTAWPSRNATHPSLCGCEPTFRHARNCLRVRRLPCPLGGRQEAARSGPATDHAVPEDDLPAADRRDDLPSNPAALERRPRMPAEQLVARDLPLAVEIPHGEIGVGTD